MKKPRALEKMIREVQKAGYRVERERIYIKHTFEVDKEALDRFFALQTSRKIKVKDAINEAIELWLLSQSK